MENPDEKMKYHAQFDDDEGIAYLETEYTAINSRTGEEINGITDENGWTKYLFSDEILSFSVIIIELNKVKP